LTDLLQIFTDNPGCPETVEEMENLVRMWSERLTQYAKVNRVSRNAVATSY